MRQVTFRAIKCAVPLKRSGGGSMPNSSWNLPRYQMRGPIEAKTLDGRLYIDPAFRAIKCAVPLKRDEATPAAIPDGTLPRYQMRGPIEAR